MSVRRSAGAVLAAGLAAAALAACGTPSADLFVVERSGAIPGARLELRVTDGGQVACNGSELRDITSDQLIDAREIVRDLDGGDEDEDVGPADRNLRLATGPGSVLSYRVRAEQGTVRWSDTSAGQPAVLRRLAAYTRTIAKSACRLAR